MENINNRTNNSNDLELLEYAQKKFYSALIEVLKIYKQLPTKIDLQNIGVATIALYTRLFLGSGIHVPNRSKGVKSFINNINNEFEKSIKSLPTNPSKSDIDNAVSKAIKSISKDLYGATIVFHMNNNLSEYCESSNDPKVLNLFKQLNAIENYIIQSSIFSQLPTKMKSRKKLIDVSDTFIDGETDISKRIAFLDIKNINSIKDYYDQLIAILTLLTNASMFEVLEPKTGTDGENRIVSEIDYTIIEIIHMIELSNNVPVSNIEYIKKIIEFMQQYNHLPGKEKNEKNSHKPFDVQLKEAISAREEAEKREDFTSPLTSKQKEKYQIILHHYKKNLELLKTDRLHNYILSKELPNIIKKISDSVSFKIDIISKKVVSKMNGFYSNYLIIRANDLADFELQSRGEFRTNIANEGNAAHNSSLPGKSFNIMHFFELDEPYPNQQTNDEYLNLFCTFLNCIQYNSIKSQITKSKSDQPYLDKLLQLVDYAKSRIRIKNDFTNEYYGLSNNEIPYTYEEKKDLANAYSHNREFYRQKLSKSTSFKYTFYDYIADIIAYHCATFGEVQANHSDGDHNTIQIKSKTTKETLLSFFKNRVGLSVLSYMLIEEYIKSSPEMVSGDYRTISNEAEANNAMKQATQRAVNSSSIDEDLQDLDSIGFRPQGQNEIPNSHSER